MTGCRKSIIFRRRGRCNPWGLIMPHRGLHQRSQPGHILKSPISAFLEREPQYMMVTLGSVQNEENINNINNEDWPKPVLFIMYRNIGTGLRKSLILYKISGSRQKRFYPVCIEYTDLGKSVFIYCA